MFTILFRKMRNTKWMVLCLFMGFLMAAGMMTTVPIYMDASLQRLLIKDMEQYQLDTGEYPGSYIVEKTIPAGTTDESLMSLINDMPKGVANEVSNIAIPVSTNKTLLVDNMQYLVHGSLTDSTVTRVKIAAMSGLKDHITIIKGRMYVEGGYAEDGVLEVIVNEESIKELGITIDNDYVVRPVMDSGSITVRIVGIYQQSNELDTYWSETMGSYLNAAFTDYDCFVNRLIPETTISLSSIYVRYMLDYQRMDMNDITSVTTAINEDFSTYASSGYTYTMGVSTILDQYKDRADSLTQMLWVLQIPTMVMLAFYLFMVSQLNVEQERNEIAVFKSRGASSKQVFALYAMEAGVLGMVTLVVAPLIGLLLCQFLGVSNGFLEFVNRSGIAAKITGTSILYALLAVAIFFVTTMLPIIPASKLTIVQYKQSKTKVVKMALWEKCFVDVALIAASGVFLYLYNTELTKAYNEGTFVATEQIDPLLFVFATCLVMGLGLLFVRLYPYLLKLVYILGKPFWSPSQYMAITTVCRSQGGKERFLMLFLVITFGFGLFSANTARAINNNKEDRIYYSNGADVTLSEYWAQRSSGDEESGEAVYIEREMSRFDELEDVEAATKVYIDDNAKATSGKKTVNNVTLMAIEPSKFAEVAWFRDDLLPVHWYNYCNALVNFKSGVIVSSSYAEQADVQLGDDISLKWSANDSVTATVIAVVDYWPGINPNDTNSNGTIKCFAVMNYTYATQQTLVEPYQVWLKLKDGATSESLYKALDEGPFVLESLTDSSQLLIEEKTEPTLQGMNGALTLGFIIIMIMTVIGFLIYWILSIKSRTLQFGILRAMGMTFKEIVGILGYEQLLVSGVSIAMAIVIGGITSDLFVPLFQSMYDIVDQIPPFLVTASSSDYLKIYVIIVLMLGGGFAVLGSIIKKININKALKLGED